jgi:hypothetical protein
MRGGRPNYGARRLPPPPEPKLDLSDKSFPSLAATPPPEPTTAYVFASKFSTTVKVMSEVEKLNELREQRNREADQKAHAEMGGVYTHRFRHGRLSEVKVEEEEGHWEPPQKLAKPDDTTEWVEVRHSKARRQGHEKSLRELDEDYRSKAKDEADAEAEYNSELFERSHRHDHYAT